MVITDKQRRWACVIFGAMMGMLWAGVFAAIYYGVEYSQSVPDLYRAKIAFWGTMLIFVFGIGTFYITLFREQIHKYLMRNDGVDTK